MKKLLKLLPVLMLLGFLIGPSAELTQAQTQASPFEIYDGEDVIFFTAGPSFFSDATEVYAVRPDGTELLRVTNNNVTDYQPQLSNDGTRLAFCRSIAPGSTQRNLIILDLATNVETIYTDDFPCGDKYSWSPDDSQIVSSSRPNVFWVINTDTPFSNFFVQTPPRAEGVRHPNWSPANNKIAFSTDIAGGGNSLGIFTLPATLSPGTTIPATDFVEYNVGSPSSRVPHWSPDGTNIAYERCCGGELRIINADGTGDRRVKGGGAFSIAYSPFGNEIAYVGLFGGNVGIVGTDGSNDRSIPGLPGGWKDGTDWGVVNITPPNPPTVEVRVWDDLDGDGIQDAEEDSANLAGIEVELRNGSGSALDPRVFATTDENGIAAFAADPGEYLIKVTVPEGYGVTRKDRGSDEGLDSDINPSNARSGSFTVVEGEVSVLKDAGLWSPGVLESRVWVDSNGNGIQNDSELGYEGATVQLRDADTNAVLQVTVTNRDGIATFNAVPADRPVRIKVVSIDGASFTGINKGSDEALDSDVIPSNGRSDTIEADRGMDFFNTLDAGIVLD